MRMEGTGRAPEHAGGCRLIANALGTARNWSAFCYCPRSSFPTICWSLLPAPWGGWKAAGIGLMGTTTGLNIGSRSASHSHAQHPAPVPAFLLSPSPGAQERLEHARTRGTSSSRARPHRWMAEVPKGNDKLEAGMEQCFPKMLPLPPAIFGFGISCVRVGIYRCNNPGCHLLSVIIPPLFESV